MEHPFTCILLLLLLLYINVCNCNQNQTQLSQESRNVQASRILIGRLKTFWTWVQKQAGSEDTFIGRCAGGFKKMRMMFSFIIFKLGVIVTSLGFLSALAFKGLGIGITILVISALGLFSKLFALKHTGQQHAGHTGSVHLHIHNKGSSGGYYHNRDHEWYERLDSVVPKNDLERNAISDLYRRLGITESYGGSSGGISVR